MINHDLIRKHGNKGGGVSVYAAWNPDDAGSAGALPTFLTNTVAVNGPIENAVVKLQKNIYNGVRATLPKKTGKYYWEIYPSYLNGSIRAEETLWIYYMQCGVCDAARNFAGWIGSVQTVAVNTNNLYHWGPGAVASGTTFGIRLRVGADLDNGIFQFRASNGAGYTYDAKVNGWVVGQDQYIFVNNQSSNRDPHLGLNTKPEDWLYPPFADHEPWAE